jgi:hypothetical protein
LSKLAVVRAATVMKGMNLVLWNSLLGLSITSDRTRLSLPASDDKNEIRNSSCELTDVR